MAFGSNVNFGSSAPSAYRPVQIAPGYVTQPQGAGSGSSLANIAAQTTAGGASGGVAGAAISGGSAIVGALLGKKGSDKATKAQTQANDQATQLARDQMAEDKRRYDEQQVLSKSQWDAMEARKDPWRRALAQRFGIPFPTATAPVSAPLATSTAASAVPQWAASALPTRNSAPMTLGGMAGMSAPPPVEAPQLTLADLGNWNKWGSPQQ